MTCRCKPRAYTVEPVAPSGETIEEVRWTLAKMMAALDKPVLSKQDFKMRQPKPKKVAPRGAPHE